MEIIRNSHLNEYFQQFSDDDIANILEDVNNEIENIRKWIFNSKVRGSTLYHLGSSESITATEIGKLISKHPKSISNYINEFKIKGWVDEPEKVGREKKYSLSETGFSHFKLAKNKGWFREIIMKPPIISEAIIAVIFYHLTSLKNSYFLGQIYQKDPSKLPEPDHYEYAEALYFEDLPPEALPSLQELIMEINTIAKTFIDQLDLEKSPPKLKVLSDCLISIRSQDDDDLALIFASFNYLEKKRIINGQYWNITGIKLITPDSYFNADMPDIDSFEGFMKSEEFEKYKRDILHKFKEKIKKRKGR